MSTSPPDDPRAPYERSTKSFMATVAELFDALDVHAWIRECVLTEGIIQTIATLRGPEDNTATEPADVRRALYERAEKVIAIAEKICDHAEHPIILMDGDIARYQGMPDPAMLTTARVELRMRPKNR